MNSEIMIMHGATVQIDTRLVGRQKRYTITVTSCDNKRSVKGNRTTREAAIKFASWHATCDCR